MQAANYLAYFLMAIPAGLIAKRFGYKGGILVGLSLIAAGAFWFIPAVNIGSVLGVSSGNVCRRRGYELARKRLRILTRWCWEHRKVGLPRINIAQTTNGAGWILGPIVRWALRLFRRLTVRMPILAYPLRTSGSGIFVTLLLVVFAMSRVPDLHAQDESGRSITEQTTLKPSGSQVAAIAVRSSCNLRGALLLCRPRFWHWYGRCFT